MSRNCQTNQQQMATKMEAFPISQTAKKGRKIMWELNVGVTFLENRLQVRRVNFMTRAELDISVSIFEKHWCALNQLLFVWNSNKNGSLATFDVQWKTHAPKFTDASRSLICKGKLTWNRMSWPFTMSQEKYWVRQMFPDSKTSCLSGKIMCLSYFMFLTW